MLSFCFFCFLICPLYNILFVVTSYFISSFFLCLSFFTSFPFFLLYSLASLFYIPSERNGCVYVVFVMDIVALKQVLIRVLRFSPCHYHSFNVPYLFVYHKYNINLSIGSIILVTQIFTFKPFFSTNNPLRLIRTSHYSAHSSFI